MNTMDFVAVDLGASSTRYMSNTGKIDILPNNMVYVDVDASVELEPYNADIESALDVTIECDNGSEHFPVRVLVGQMAERYSTVNSRPSVMANKHKQRINYISSVLATALSKHKHELGDNIQLYLAMPPIEARSAKEIVKKNLIGTYKVTFNNTYGNNKLVVEFKIEDVGTYEESFMAILAYFFDKNGKVKGVAEQYAKGKLLSLDIGASTTDLAIVNDMKYLERSGQTYKTGGNVAREYLVNKLRGEYGFDVPIEMAEMAMAEGRIQMGNTYQDCSAYVEEAKREFAEQIVEQIQNYFRTVGIPIQTIRAIIVSGGGSMEGQYVNDDGNIVVTSNSMSSYITEALRDICPGVAVEQFKESPRLANITGLFIRANIDVRRKLREREQNKGN